MKKPKPVVAYDAPAGTCAACQGPHELRGCDTPEAIAMLEAQDRLMSADEVRLRMALAPSTTDDRRASEMGGDS